MRFAESYRGARRNAFHGNWPETPTKVQVAPPVRPNKRDRSRDGLRARAAALWAGRRW